MREVVRGLRARHSLGAIILAILAVLVLASLPGVVSGLVIKGQIDASNASQQAKLHTAQVKACERQNIRQATANRNGLASWRFDTLFAKAIEHPVSPQAHQTARQRKLTRDFLGLLLETANSLAWTPLNHHCSSLPSAVQLPVNFSKAHLPSKRDLPPQTRTVRSLPSAG